MHGQHKTQVKNDMSSKAIKSSGIKSNQSNKPGENSGFSSFVEEKKGGENNQQIGTISHPTEQ